MAIFSLVARRRLPGARLRLIGGFERIQMPLLSRGAYPGWHAQLSPAAECWSGWVLFLGRRSTAAQGLLVGCRSRPATAPHAVFGVMAASASASAAPAHAASTWQRRPAWLPQAPPPAVP